MTYRITTEYLEHDGGTKFYELVLIREEGGPAILLKRFGKLADRIGGGQVQATRGSYDVCEAEYEKVLAAKQKGKTGQGRYQRTTTLPDYGLHKVCSKNIDGPGLHKLVELHYSAAYAATVHSYFDLTHDGVAESAVDIPPDDFAVEAAKTDASWGSW